MVHSTLILRSCAALAALLTAACADPISGREDAISITDRFPITVEPRMETLRIPYDVARGDIDDAGIADLRRIARDFIDSGSGAIGVSAPRRSPDLSARIADRLVAFGVPRGRIMMGTESALNGADDVRLTYIRYQAHAAPCGDWSVNLGYTSANQPAPNLGCATQHNLAAMVADPRDLVAPKALEPADAQRRLTVLDKYRKGEVTGSTKSQEQSGAVSDIKTGSGGGQ